MLTNSDNLYRCTMEAPHPQGPPDRYKGTKTMAAMAVEEIQRKREGIKPATEDKYGDEMDPIGRKKNEHAFFFCC